MGNRQYPRTLATQPNETPVMLMRFRRQYMPRQPMALIPYTYPNWILPVCTHKDTDDMLMPDTKPEQ